LINLLGRRLFLESQLCVSYASAPPPATTTTTAVYALFEGPADQTHSAIFVQGFTPTDTTLHLPS